MYVSLLISMYILNIALLIISLSRTSPLSHWIPAVSSSQSQQPQDQLLLSARHRQAYKRDNPRIGEWMKTRLSTKKHWPKGRWSSKYGHETDVNGPCVHDLPTQNDWMFLDSMATITDGYPTDCYESWISPSVSYNGPQMDSWNTVVNPKPWDITNFAENGWCKKLSKSRLLLSSPH